MSKVGYQLSAPEERVLYVGLDMHVSEVFDETPRRLRLRANRPKVAEELRDGEFTISGVRVDAAESVEQVKV